MTICTDLDGTLIEYPQYGISVHRIKRCVCKYLSDKEFIIVTGRISEELNKIIDILESNDLSANCTEIYCYDGTNYFDGDFFSGVSAIRNWKFKILSEIKPHTVLEDDSEVLKLVKDFVPNLILVRDDTMIEINKRPWMK